jgi:hypothetical protein
LETCCSSAWNRCDLTTVWAGYAKFSLLILDFQALLAVNIGALELLRGVKTDRMVELLFYLLRYFFSHLNGDRKEGVLIKWV